MAARRASFGMVVLVVTMAIVLLLVARRWQQLASSSSVSGAAFSTTPAAQAEAGSDGMPGLREAEASTDAHADAVGEAFEASQD
jgi:hypothetical protein